jgi:hypothetical protein
MLIPLLSQNKKCIGYIVTITEGTAATKAAITEAAATGTAATGGVAISEHPQEQQPRKPPRQQQSHSSS